MISERLKAKISVPKAHLSIYAIHFTKNNKFYLHSVRDAPCWGNRREGDHWGHLGVDGWIILGWISRRWDVGIRTGLGWPRIETGGGRL